MSRELKVANRQKGRKLRLKIYLTGQKSCNLLPQIEKQQQQQQQKNKKKNKNVNICGRWKVQNRAVVAFYREKKEKKKFFKKLNVEEIKCRNTSTSSQVSNCDGVVLEIYFDNKLQ